MIALVRTEWLKIKKYRAFWWILAITALSYPGINYIFYNVYQQILKNKETGEIARFLIGDPFTFPEVFHSVAYFSSWFIFIPSIIVIMLITNEYTFKTHRQNIIDGWSRNQFMTSKLSDVAIVSVLVTVLYFLVALSSGILNGSELNFNKSYFTFLFLLQTFAQLSIAFFIGYIFKRAVFALAAFLFYFTIIENVLVNVFYYYVHDLGRFLPFEISDRLIPPPGFLGKFNEAGYSHALASINYHIAYTIILTSLFWWICYRVNNKRDL